MSESANRLIPAERLRAFATDVLTREGLPAEDAAIVARHMVQADLLGGEGHGMFRLPRYLERLRQGGINPTPKIRVEREMGAMAVVDGDNAFGHLVIDVCAREAVERARKFGIGWVGAHHSNHAGAAGTYALLPLEAGMIGIYGAVGSSNHMAPWGGTELLLSTNPIAAAIPAGKRPTILLDMATTVSAYGKIKVAAQRGEMIPEGWMIDKDGNPITDPNKAAGGSLLPIGGPKGYGLALLIGILAGTLNGAAMGRDLVDYNKDEGVVTNTGQFMVALNIGAFIDPEVFRDDIDRIIDEMKSSPTRPGFDDIRLPGERALAVHAKRSAEGVPMTATMAGILNDIAASCGAEPL